MEKVYVNYQYPEVTGTRSRTLEYSHSGCLGSLKMQSLSNAINHRSEQSVITDITIKFVSDTHANFWLGTGDWWFKRVSALWPADRQPLSVSADRRELHLNVEIPADEVMLAVSMLRHMSFGMLGHLNYESHAQLYIGNRYMSAAETLALAEKVMRDLLKELKKNLVDQVKLVPGYYNSQTAEFVGYPVENRLRGGLPMASKAIFGEHLATIAACLNRFQFINSRLPDNTTVHDVRTRCHLDEHSPFALNIYNSVYSDLQWSLITCAASAAMGIGAFAGVQDSFKVQKGYKSGYASLLNCKGTRTHRREYLTPLSGTNCHAGSLFSHQVRVESGRYGPSSSFHQTLNAIACVYPQPKSSAHFKGNLSVKQYASVFSKLFFKSFLG